MDRQLEFLKALQQGQPPAWAKVIWAALAHASASASAASSPAPRGLASPRYLTSPASTSQRVASPPTHSPSLDKAGKSSYGRPKRLLPPSIQTDHGLQHGYMRVKGAWKVKFSLQGQEHDGKICASEEAAARAAKRLHAKVWQGSPEHGHSVRPRSTASPRPHSAPEASSQLPYFKYPELLRRDPGIGGPKKEYKRGYGYDTKQKQFHAVLYLPQGRIEKYFRTEIEAVRYVVEKHKGAGGKADDIPEHEGRYPNLHTGKPRKMRAVVSPEAPRKRAAHGANSAPQHRASTGAHCYLFPALLESAHLNRQGQYKRGYTFRSQYGPSGLYDVDLTLPDGRRLTGQRFETEREAATWVVRRWRKEKLQARDVPQQEGCFPANTSGAGKHKGSAPKEASKKRSAASDSVQQVAKRPKSAPRPQIAGTTSALQPSDAALAVIMTRDLVGDGMQLHDAAALEALEDDQGSDDETDSIEEQIKDLACLDLSAQRQHTAALCQLSDNGVGAGCQALQDLQACQVLGEVWGDLQTQEEHAQQLHQRDWLPLHQTQEQAHRRSGWAKGLGIQASQHCRLRGLLPASCSPQANCWVVEVEGLAQDGLPQAFVCTSRSIPQGTQLLLGRPPAQAQPAAPAAQAQRKKKRGRPRKHEVRPGGHQASMQEHARAPLPAVKISPSSAETQAMLAGGHEHAAASSTATHGPVDALRGPQAHAAGLQSQTREERVSEATRPGMSVEDMDAERARRLQELTALQRLVTGQVKQVKMGVEMFGEQVQYLNTLPRASSAGSERPEEAQKQLQEIQRLLAKGRILHAGLADNIRSLA